MNERTALTNDAIYWRGLFIHRYAGIEFSLTQLLFMASRHSDFSHLGDIPFKQSSKLNRLEKLITLGGNLSSYAEELRQHTAFLNTIEEARHFIAHGMMVVRIMQAEPICLFRMYRHVDGMVVPGVWDIKLDAMKSLAEEIQPHSTAFTSLVARIGKLHF